MSAVSMGQKFIPGSPPARGSFPLDHESECWETKTEYLKCLRTSFHDNKPCRPWAVRYMACRMDRGLMMREEFTNLGFTQKEIDEGLGAKKTEKQLDAGMDDGVAHTKVTNAENIADNLDQPRWPPLAPLKSHSFDTSTVTTCTTTPSIAFPLRRGTVVGRAEQRELLLAFQSPTRSPQSSSSKTAEINHDIDSPPAVFKNTAPSEPSVGESSNSTPSPLSDYQSKESMGFVAGLQVIQPATQRGFFGSFLSSLFNGPSSSTSHSK